MTPWKPAPCPVIAASCQVGPTSPPATRTPVQQEEDQQQAAADDGRAIEP
jgi:hypothetical protein